MPTDYKDLSPDVIKAFEDAHPCSQDPTVLQEVRDLEVLFGCPMPDEVSRFLETERSELFDPSPSELVAMEHPFEALILRAQEMDDTAAVLFPLTGSIFLRSVGGVEVLGHVTGVPCEPVMPFAGWRREKWAYDLPSFNSLTKALMTFLAGNDEYDDEDDEDDEDDDDDDDDDDDYDEYDEPRVGRQAEALLKPVWGRVQPTQWTQNMFDAIDGTEVEERLDATVREGQDLRPRLTQWWRHERCLFLGFALIGKFRPPETDAFAHVPWGALDTEHFLTNLGAQMNLLWRGWFLNEENLLERTMAATEASKSRLVQDARRLITELLDGRTMIGSVDMHEARAHYKTWIDDPGAYQRAQRATRRTALEACVEPSPTGIELARALWPLHADPTTEPSATPVTHAWNGETLSLSIPTEGGTTEHALAPPDEALKIYLGNSRKSAVSPSGRRFTCTATVHRPRADTGGWENAPVLVEHNLDTQAWRVLVDVRDLQWMAYVEEDRWVLHNQDHVYLLRDLGDEFDCTAPAFTGQPHTFHLPELGALIAYGKTDLVEGRNPGDLKSPWIRVYGYARDRLACIAGFPLDGVQLVAKQAEGRWLVGLVSADREVAWELRSLGPGLEAWRSAQNAEAQSRDCARGEGR